MADASSNTLSSGVLEELDSLVAMLESRAELTGVVFKSAKSSGVIVGADGVTRMQVRGRERHLETVVGRVTVPRQSYGVPGATTSGSIAG